MNRLRIAWRWVAANNHRLQAYAWMVLAIPTLLWWKDSILWVGLMSLYANIESSFSAHDYDRAERERKERQREQQASGD